jgi:hypothetical protein
VSLAAAQIEGEQDDGDEDEDAAAQIEGKQDEEDEDEEGEGDDGGNFARGKS